MNIHFHTNQFCSAIRVMLSVVLLVIFSNQMHAQLDVQNGLTPEEYVNDVLLGEGVAAFNVSYTGGLDQLGKLINGADSDYSFNEGLVMSTEHARGIGCSSSTCDDCLGETVTDSSLLMLANQVPGLIGENFVVDNVLDVSILEFDFIVTGDSIGFDYIFGSDEYETWVNTPYNDVFGFFLSGPDIVGPFESPANFPNGAINIAGVPNSDPNLPITVSSVNSNLNAEYFVSNLPYDGICINGYTSVFHAGHPVQCGETYHIKLAIADGSDAGLESVVILEQGSFVSNVPVEVVASIDLGEDDESLLFEGCGTLDWTFTRPEDVPVDSTYSVILNFDQGTAINGLDFAQLMPDGGLQAFGDTITFAPGTSSMDFTLVALSDGLEEGPESIVATLSSLESCLDGFIYLTYEISDGPESIEIDSFNTVACSNLQIIVQPEVTGGYGNYAYDWSCSNSTAPSITVSTDEDWVCMLTVTDTCGLDPVSAVNSITLLDPVPLVVDLQPDSIEIIPGDSVFMYASIDGGLSFGGMYSVSWYVNDELAESGFDTLFNAVPDVFDIVTVEVEDGCGNEVEDELFIDAYYTVNAVITALDSTMGGPDSLSFYACKGNELLWSPSASTATLDSILYYMWNWGDGTTEYSLSDTIEHEWNEPGIYEVTLAMAGPYDSFDVSEPFTVTVLPKPNIQFLVDTPVCIGGIGEAEVSVYSSQLLQTAAYDGASEQLSDSMATTYSFPIAVNGFSEDAVIDSCSDMRKIRATLEHSYVGALDIWVSCPNGAELFLMQNNQGETDDCNGTSDVDDANLGQPIIGMDNDTAGIGYTYTWRSAGLYLLDDANNSALNGGTVGIGSYTSCEDWCALEGCPVNGEWSLHIATLDSLGDGHFFGWNFQFEHDELDSLGLSSGTELDLSNGGFDWNTLPESAAIEEDSTGLYATYEALSIGNHVVNFSAIDAFGCSTTKYRSISVNDGLGFAVEGGPNPNACSSVVNLSAGLVNTSYTDCPGMPYSSSWCVENNADTVFTVCPLIQGDGTQMHLSFQNALMDSIGDFIVVHDGPDVSYPVLGTYSGNISNLEWGSDDPSGCLTFRVVTNASQSCGDGTYPPFDFTIDCNPFFLDVLWQWSPGDMVVDSTAQSTQALDGATAMEYVVMAYLDGQSTCFSSDTLQVMTQLNAEWLAFQPDCDVSNGTLVIDVDSPGYSGGGWVIELNPSDSTQASISEPSNGDPMAFTFLPNGIYGVNVSNDNCSFDTEIELNSEENESALPCGCTYPFFDNYDPEALIDDGSCAFEPGGGGGGGGGCDYESWCEEYYEDGCQADLDGNGIIAIGDLLDLMTLYGNACADIAD